MSFGRFYDFFTRPVPFVLCGAFDVPRFAQTPDVFLDSTFAWRDSRRRLKFEKTSWLSTACDAYYTRAFVGPLRSTSIIPWRASWRGIGCTISVVSSGPQRVHPPAAQERNWLPIAVAAAILLAVGGGLVIVFEHGKRSPAVTPISAPADPYAGNLAISGLAMSESSNLAGGKSTYLDGQIANRGSRTVTGITVQALFRDPAHEVAQNETQPLKIVRTREPYIDTEPLSAAPLQPGGQADFRLVFDTVAQDWDGAFPEVRIIHVDLK